MGRTVVLLFLIASLPASADPITPWRGRLAYTLDGARVSLSRDGAWLAGTIREGVQLVIEDDTGARPRFVENAGGASLVVYVERAKLRDVTLPGAELYPSVAAARQPLGDVSPGIKLLSGVWFDDPVPVKGGLLKITIAWGDQDRLEMTGYLRSSAVGKVHEHEYSKEFDPDVTLPKSFKLLDAPGGAPFLVRTSPERVAAEMLQRGPRYSLVRLYMRATGWVPSSEIRPIGLGEPVFDTLQIPPFVNQRSPGAVTGDETVPVGTPLFDAIDGRVIGTVSGGFPYYPSRRSGTWCRYDIETRFGRLAAWARVCASGTPPVRIPDVKMKDLLANLVQGDALLAPNDATRAEMARDGKTQAWATFKICVDATGAVSDVDARGSKIAAYDRQIDADVLKWKFRPFIVDGAATAVCSFVVTRYPPRPAAPAHAP